MYTLLKNALSQGKKTVKQGRQEDINRSPVIVLGNQKSGTSAVAHLLADYADLTKTVDIPEIFWPTIGRLLSGERRLIDFVNKYRFRFSTDLIKEPNLTFFYDQLKTIFPEAVFVYVVRDPRDNIRSILNWMGVPGNLEVLQLEKISLARPIKKYWLPILDPAVLGADTAHYIQTLAVRWNRMVDVYLQCQTEMTLVRYEDFVTDKTGTIGQVAERLRLSEKRNIVDKVDIQYQPPGNKDVAWLDFFGKTNLGYIERICNEKMAAFGYPPA